MSSGLPPKTAAGKRKTAPGTPKTGSGAAGLAAVADKFRRVFRKNPPVLLPPALSAVFFLGLYLFLRFSPYGALAAFLERPYSTRFYDRRGTLVQIIPLEDGLRREYVNPETLPPAFTAVFLAAEDERFYSHPGIDPLAVIRAAWQNLRERRTVSGASTITMQLARIIDSRGRLRRNIFSKTGEAFNALRLEARFSKKQIMDLYLNSIPFGFQTEGTASAARNFFASDISLLTPAEVFCLAVIPRRPAAYNPLEEREACIDAARKLAERFAENPRRSAAFPLYAALDGGDWEALRPRYFTYPQFMPHLIRHVHTRLMEAHPRGGSGGFPAEYTLSADLELQRYAEDLVAANIRRYASSRLSNGAAIVIDNRTGEVLAWVGSADYYDESALGQIDGVLAANQMGSSMKPFLYALALERGWKPSDVLADIPSAYGDREVYIPRNFNNRFNGPVLFRTALASSLNIPAVDLLSSLGVRNYAAFLASAGFSSLANTETAEEAGLGLALGNAPVSLAELAAAFSIFPRDGAALPLRFDTEHQGDRAEPVRIMEADTARLICSILSDPRARRLAFGRGMNFQTPFPAIFKTGTANQYQSIAALGATPRFTAAVWMGNFSGETVMGRTGSSLPASVVRSLLIRLQDSGGSRPEDISFREPESWTKVPVCALSGMAPTAACPAVIEEYLPPGAGTESCTWHVFRGGPGVVYPPEYQSWFLSQPREGDVDYAAAPLQIVTPRNNYSFLSSSGAGSHSIPVEVIGGAGEELTVDYSGTTFTVTRPFVFFLPYRPGRHTLTVINGGEIDTVHFTAE
ncbi:MAG: transglycosylase domain-containing protein [Treponema sp.]|nr:transglycosylase domain-containing protein [Treponema sp.]